MNSMQFQDTFEIRNLACIYLVYEEQCRTYGAGCNLFVQADGPRH